MTLELLNPQGQKSNRARASCGKQRLRETKRGAAQSEKIKVQEGGDGEADVEVSGRRDGTVIQSN